MKKSKTTVWTSTSVLLVALSQSALMLSVEAEIFKCTNKQGKVYYNDKPCPVENEEKKIQNEKDPLNGYVPPTNMHQGDHEKIQGAKAGEQLGKSFIKTDKETSSDDGIPEDSPGNNTHGVSSNSAPRDKRPVMQFHDEGKKIELTGEANKHPAPIVKRKNGGKLTLNEKKAMLGIRTIPE